MNNRIKTIAAILSTTLMISLVAVGCTQKEQVGETAAPKQTDAPATVAPVETKAEPAKTEPVASTDAAPSPETTAAPAGNTATTELNKIASLSFSDRRMDGRTDYGIIYKNEADKYGFVTYDGKNDTGLVYADVKWSKFVLCATTNGTELAAEVESVNRNCLLDSTGKAITPEVYAFFEKLGDRYVVAAKATEKTDSKDEMLFCIDTLGFSWLGGRDGDPMFKGEWSVYDLQTGQPVPGATGTKNGYLDVYGDFLKYKDDAGNAHIVDPSGAELRSDAILLKNGTYVLKEPSTASVCNVDGSVLFSFDPNEYDVTYIAYNGVRLGGYFAVKNVGGEKSYFLLDGSGQIVSAELQGVKADGTLGNLIIGYDNTQEANTHLYLRDGTVLTEGKLISIGEDSFFQRAVYCREKNGEEENYLLFDWDGNLLLKVPCNDAYTVSMILDEHAIKQNDKNLYYNFKDESYSIPGIPTDLWFIESENAGGKKDLVDAFTGETSMRGYDRYYAVVANGTAYVLGMNNTVNAIDVFEVNH